MQKLMILLLGLFLYSPECHAQQFTDLSKQVPFDKEIKRGVLPNGITYYIRHNKEPKERVSFYLYQNVGAVLETEDQNGLAHFLEHMAFNGTKNFPGKSMLDMLERNGVKFGRDVNAYTAHNETVYNISRVPSTNKGLVDSCLLMLHDWCNALDLKEKEIDKERGVISEEWRTRRNAGFRIRAKLAPTQFNNSIYAYRDVIGDLDVIKNFDPNTLRQFYHDWYRTDLQAVAVVGDIDPEAVERKIIELFSAIPPIENPKERPFISIPDNKEPMYVAARDKDYQNVKMSLMVRHKMVSDNTLESMRQNYVYRFFNTLIKSRFSEVAQKGNAPFLSGGVSFGSLIRGYTSFNVSATARKDEQREAFEAVYTILQSVLNNGFTKGELERLKTNMLVSTEQSYIHKDKVRSDSYCKSLKNVYLKNLSLSDAEFIYRFAKEIIPTITVEEVSAVASKYLTDLNRVYTVTGPEDEEVHLLSQKELEEIIAKVEAKTINRYVDNVPDNANLLSKVPRGGKILKETKLDAFDAWEWTLSNGAKVVYRFADYKKESVALKGISYGGSSLYEPADLPSLGAVGSFIKGFGIGEYDPAALKKLMTGKSAGSGFKIGAYTESVSGVATPEDIEAMMQLVYMRFEEPRFDKEKYNNLLERNYKNLKHKIETTSGIMKDTLRVILANGNPRSMKFDEHYLDEMSFERMKEIYKERISNAADFTFFIVGDIDKEILKPLVAKYIGSINSTGSKEKWHGRKNYFPKGKNEHRICLPMEDPKATVLLKIKNKAGYSRETVIYHTILKSILDLRFMESIREKEGGTYGVGVKSGASRIPEMRLSMDIKFNCDPDRADYLKSLVYKELDIIQKTVQQSDLDKVVLNMKKNAENSHERNSYWMSALQLYYDTGENMLEPEYFDEVIDNVSTKDIVKAARKFFKKADILDVVFLPEEKN
jgi:zinc protease